VQFAASSSVTGRTIGIVQAQALVEGRLIDAVHVHARQARVGGSVRIDTVDGCIEATVDGRDGESAGGSHVLD